MTTQKANEFISQNKAKVNQEFRLTFHGMPQYGWMNDPNGLVYFNGMYHVFYQHHPYDSAWGSMHWGHMVSSDLVHFKYLPVALAPDLEDETGCFSGCALIDKQDPQRLHLMYTRHHEQDGVVRQTQAIATSDDGICFTKRMEPIITSSMVEPYTFTSDVRDPAVYIKEDDYYILIGAKGYDHNGKLLIFTSKDLSTFQFHHEWKNPDLFGDMVECPAIVDIDDKQLLLYSKIDDNLATKNVRNFSNYVIGTLDIANQTYDIETFGYVDSGHHFYAPQLLTDDSGRVILIGWMEMWGSKLVTHELGHHWYGALTLPREVHIRNGLLYQQPIAELKSYRADSNPLQQAQYVDKHLDIEITNTDEPFSLSFQHSNDTQESFDITFDGTHVIIDGTSLHLETLERHKSHREYNQVSLRIIVDTSSFEVFVNDGIETFTSRVYIRSKQYHLITKGNPSGTIHTIDLSEVKQ